MEYQLFLVAENLLPDELKGVFEQHSKFTLKDDELVVIQDGVNDEVFTAVLTVGDKKYVVNRPAENGFIVRRIFSMDTEEKDPVLRMWGPYKDIHRFGQHQHDRSISRWFIDMVASGRMKSLFEVPDYMETVNIRDRLLAFQPIRSTLSVDKIAIFQTRTKRHEDVQTAMKPGRAISMMFPELEHKEVIYLVDEYLKKFAQREFTLHVSDKAEDFKHAYSGEQSYTENICTTFSRKSSASSCMRYEFDNLPYHPAEAYASGDFKIIWTEDSNGKIASRAVAYFKNGWYNCGPVYGVSEHAIDKIEEFVLSNGGVLADDASWVGARLQRFEADGGGFYAPYLDMSPQSLHDDGEYLVVDRHGEISATDYQGILASNYTHCCECGDGLNQDEYYHSEYNCENYCESCFFNEHIYCEYLEGTVHREECTEVYVPARWASDGYTTELIATDALQGCEFLKVDSEWWHEDLVTFCEYEDSYIPNHIVEETYFMCEISGEIFPHEQWAETDCGMVVARHTLETDSKNWVLNEDGAWSVKEEGEE